MGIKDVNIILDSEFNTYYSGQIINGRIEYTLDTPKSIRGICITFKGEANTRWTKREHYTVGGKSKSTNVRYHGNENYFKTKYYLVGSEDGESMDLPPGKNIYPFTCQLPFDLPSSFEGEFGHVRYTIKITLDRPWKFDQDTKMAFTIISNYDLNLNPECIKPIEFNMVKSFGWCCCPSGSVKINVRIPVSGFCSGQAIPFDITCENNSSNTVGDVIIRLRKNVTFRSHYPRHSSKYRTINIAEHSLGRVNGNMSLNWQQHLQIPPLPPSNLKNCSIIDLDYEVQVVCSPSGCCSTDKDKSRPIFIGTIPLHGFQMPSVESGAPIEVTETKESLNREYNFTPEPNSSVPLLPLPGSPYPMPGASVPSAPNLPPSYDSVVQPTYPEGQFTAQSIFGDDDNENMRIHGRNDFAPRYPTYGFVMPPDYASIQHSSK